jgi:hypothetical protein
MSRAFAVRSALACEGLDRAADLYRRGALTLAAMSTSPAWGSERETRRDVREMRRIVGFDEKSEIAPPLET